MQIVELDVLRDALVGVPGQSGLSVEARKRLSIAVEQVPRLRCRSLANRSSHSCIVSAPVCVKVAKSACEILWLPK